MMEFQFYLKSQNIVEYLINFYEICSNASKVFQFINKVIGDLNEVDNFQIDFNPNINNINYDIFSTLYEKNMDPKERKLLGEFYTPLPIVDYILQAVNYDVLQILDNKKLIDISCGSGSFLIRAVLIFIKNWKKKKKIQDFKHVNIKDLKKLILLIKNSIIGVDINPIACIFCQLNIQFVLFNIIKKIRKEDNSFHVPLFNIHNQNAFKFDISEKYDYIVGNPPYLFIRDIPIKQRQIIEESNIETNDGQYDYYQIFLELGIKLLKDHGYLGYIIPDSLLALSNRTIIRKYIYNNTKIKEIYHTGPKFDDPVVSNIILILQKENRKIEREENQIRMLIQNDNNILLNSVKQNVLKDWSYKFLINLNSMDISLINKLNNQFPKLRDLIKDPNFSISMSRGVELGKEGKVIYCEKCKKFLPLPKKELRCKECNYNLDDKSIERIIYDNKPKESNLNLELFLYSINRFLIKEYKYIDISKQGINYKDLDIYKNRIIIRQISQNSLICATFDKRLSLTSQSLYNLKINDSPIREFNNYYLLGLINSKLLSFYFIKSFGSYKKLFPRILIEKIKSLPVMIPKNKEEKDLALKIIDAVKELLKTDLKDEDERINYQHKLDSLIYQIYQISVKKRSYISNFMKEF